MFICMVDNGTKHYKQLIDFFPLRLAFQFFSLSINLTVYT